MSAEGRRPGRRRLSDGERTLWHEVTRSVAPLKRVRRLAEARVPEACRRSSAGSEGGSEAGCREAHRTGAAGGEAPRPKPAPGLAPLERRQKKRLARGTLPIEARIDLHGCTQHEAHAALLQFLRRAQGQGAASCW